MTRRRGVFINVFHGCAESGRVNALNTRCRPVFARQSISCIRLSLIRVISHAGRGTNKLSVSTKTAKVKPRREKIAGSRSRRNTRRPRGNVVELAVQFEKVNAIKERKDGARRGEKRRRGEKAPGNTAASLAASSSRHRRRGHLQFKWRNGSPKTSNVSRFCFDAK